MKITFLGTGTSHGVPEIDCVIADYAKCPQKVCAESLRDPKHARTRSSIFIEGPEGNVLIDTSQDFRAQMLAQGVKKIDAVLFTHHHADHVGGLPDIRSYCRRGNAMPIYGSRETIETLKARFSYIFIPPAIKGGGIPVLEPYLLQDRTTTHLLGLDVTPVQVEHGSAEECFGYRIDNIAYVPDMKVMPEESKKKLFGLDVLILNALRRGPKHPTHLTLDESIALAKELNSKNCYFTHLSHDIHYANDQSRLPQNMHFAYDGLTVTI